MRERGTGTTTKMLREAIGLAMQGERVYTIWPHMNHIDYSLDLIAHLLDGEKIDFSLDRKKNCININNGCIYFMTPRTADIDFEAMRIRGVDKDTPIFVDHSVREGIEYG